MAFKQKIKIFSSIVAGQGKKPVNYFRKKLSCINEKIQRDQLEYVKERVLRNSEYFWKETKWQKWKIRAAVKLLNDEDMDVRRAAAVSLYNAFENKLEMNDVMPGIVQSLNSARIGVVDSNLRTELLFIILAYAEKGGIVAGAVPILAEIMLDDINLDIRSNAASTLEAFARHEHDIVIAMPALLEALQPDNKFVRRSASAAISNMASSGKNIGNYLDDIKGLIECETDPEVMENLVNALAYSALKGNEENRLRVIRIFKEMAQSRWIAAEAEENSPAYEALTTRIADFMESLRYGERKREEVLA